MKYYVSESSNICCVSRVTFRFRNSKKSNNGTDGNAGQIPQLLYRLPAVSECVPATSAIGRKTDQLDAVHVLSLDFSQAVSPVRTATHVYCQPVRLLSGLNCLLINEMNVPHELLHEVS